jgi:hypothetical protein
MADQAAFNLLLLFSTQPCGTCHAKTTAPFIHVTCVPSILSRMLSMCTSALLSCFIISATIHLEVSFLLRNHKMTWCWAAYWVSYGVPDKTILLKFSFNILLWIPICHFLKSCQTLKLSTVEGISIFTFEHWSLAKLFFWLYFKPCLDVWHAQTMGLVKGAVLH